MNGASSCLIDVLSPPPCIIVVAATGPLNIGFYSCRTAPPQVKKGPTGCPYFSLLYWTAPCPRRSDGVLPMPQLMVIAGDCFSRYRSVDRIELWQICLSTCGKCWGGVLHKSVWSCWQIYLVPSTNVMWWAKLLINHIVSHVPASTLAGDSEDFLLFIDFYPLRSTYSVCWTPPQRQRKMTNRHVTYWILVVDEDNS